MSTSFDELCRLCLDNPGVSSIFETEDLDRDIFNCTGVKIYPSDNLPQKICETCSEIVTNAAKLRQVAVKSYETLKIFIKDDDDNDDSSLSPLECTLSLNGNCEEKQDDTVNNEKLRIRTDLFDTSLSTDENITVVESKKEYDRAKERINQNPDLKHLKILFKCKVCKKKCTTWKKLYLHLRTHDKKFCCQIDVCGKRFATKGDLEKHYRTHTGVKPYLCHICDKRFTQKGALKTHIETVHFCFTVP